MDSVGTSVTVGVSVQGLKVAVAAAVGGKAVLVGAGVSEGAVVLVLVGVTGAAVGAFCVMFDTAVCTAWVWIALNVGCWSTVGTAVGAELQLARVAASRITATIRSASGFELIAFSLSGTLK